MKKLLHVLLFIISVPVMAQTQILEFDQTKEVQCYNEIKKLSCLNSNGEENAACVESKKAKLTADCQLMHKAKKEMR